MKRWLVAAALICAASCAQAQGVNGFQAATPQPSPYGNLGVYNGTMPAGTAYLTTLTPIDIPSGPPVNGVLVGDLIANRQIISLDQFASAQQVQGIVSQQNQLAYFMRRDVDRLSEGIALAGSFNVLPPNPGDRFAVSIGGAGYNGTGAGSFSASARINDDTIIYGAIARGPTQTMVKGGVGWSFR